MSKYNFTPTEERVFGEPLDAFDLLGKPISERIRQGEINFCVSTEALQDTYCNGYWGRRYTPPISDKEIKEWKEADKILDKIDLNAARKRCHIVDDTIEKDKAIYSTPFEELINRLIAP